MRDKEQSFPFLSNWNADKYVLAMLQLLALVKGTKLPRISLKLSVASRLPQTQAQLFYHQETLLTTQWGMNLRQALVGAKARTLCIFARKIRMAFT